MTRMDASVPMHRYIFSFFNAYRFVIFFNQTWRHVFHVILVISNHLLIVHKLQSIQRSISKLNTDIIYLPFPLCQDCRNIYLNKVDNLQHPCLNPFVITKCWYRLLSHGVFSHIVCSSHFHSSPICFDLLFYILMIYMQFSNDLVMEAHSIFFKHFSHHSL